MNTNVFLRIFLVLVLGFGLSISAVGNANADIREGGPGPANDAANGGIPPNSPDGGNGSGETTPSNPAPTPSVTDIFFVEATEDVYV